MNSWPSSEVFLLFGRYVFLFLFPCFYGDGGLLERQWIVGPPLKCFHFSEDMFANFLNFDIWFPCFYGDGLLQWWWPLGTAMNSWFASEVFSPVTWTSGPENLTTGQTASKAAKLSNPINSVDIENSFIMTRNIPNTFSFSGTWSVKDQIKRFLKSFWWKQRALLRLMRLKETENLARRDAAVKVCPEMFVGAKSVWLGESLAGCQPGWVVPPNSKLPPGWLACKR